MSFAFVFPGQGSQSLNMMDGLKDISVVKDTFSRAQEILNIDFLSMLGESTPDNINQTINTQPLMLCSGYASYLVWADYTGKTPQIVAGHSLGEWTALVVANVLTFEDALKLVKLRSQFMQEAVASDKGAMAAVLGLEDDKIIVICDNIEKEYGGVVAGVNFNSAGQVVIAGDKKLVEIAVDRLKEVGARRVQTLSVSVPSHCLLMKPAADKLSAEINQTKFNSPNIPIIHNVNANISKNVDEIKMALVKQLYSPVLWSASINKIVSTNINQIIECGPGKVLSSLNKRINENITSFNLHSMDDIEKVNIAVS